MDERIPQIGQHVIFCDSKSVDHDALVTCVHTAECVNLLIVSGDAEKKDNYGRQIERPTSIRRMDSMMAHGFYFRFPDEEKKPYNPPIST